MAFHPTDIQLMMEAAGKHYLWKTTYPFKDKDLDLSAVIDREFKRPPRIPGKEPHWIIQQWDELIAFMTIGRHLELTTEGIEDVANLTGKYPKISKGKQVAIQLPPRQRTPSQQLGTEHMEGRDPPR